MKKQMSFVIVFLSLLSGKLEPKMYPQIIKSKKPETINLDPNKELPEIVIIDDQNTTLSIPKYETEDITLEFFQEDKGLFDIKDSKPDGNKLLTPKPNSSFITRLKINGVHVGIIYLPKNNNNKIYTVKYDENIGDMTINVGDIIVMYKYHYTNDTPNTDVSELTKTPVVDEYDGKIFKTVRLDETQAARRNYKHWKNTGNYLIFDKYEHPIMYQAITSGKKEYYYRLDQSGKEGMSSRETQHKWITVQGKPTKIRRRGAFKRKTRK